MNLQPGRAVTVLCGALVLVGGANLATYAANGHPLLLGRVNHESQTATVTMRGDGPALSLQTGQDSPPLAVTSTKRVDNLNADTVDGVNASALRTRTRILTDADTGTDYGTAGAEWSLSAIPRGRYLVSWDVSLDPVMLGTTLICGIGNTDFSRQFATDTETYVANGGNKVFLTGSTAMDVNPAKQAFFCQAGSGPGLGLASPLTISFTKIDKAITSTVVGTPVHVPKSNRNGGPR
jgi:hypothetical protein